MASNLLLFYYRPGMMDIAVWLVFQSLVLDDDRELDARTLCRLERRGHVSVVGGKPVLTAAGLAAEARAAKALERRRRA